MAISKAEGVALGAGIVSLAGAFLLRKHISPETRANATIFGVGALATGGAMWAYRRHRARVLSGPLGLQATNQVRAGGKNLTVWDDKQMDIQHRIHLLQGLVATSVQDPTMRNLALAITGHGTRKLKVGDTEIEVTGAGCPARDDLCEAKAIYDWVYSHVRYTGDTGAHVLKPGTEPEPVDEFQSAPRTAEFKGGDCDDHSVLAATLGIKNGFPAKFRITSNHGDSWDHIYTMLGVPKLNPTHWIAVDTTLGDPGRGTPGERFNQQPHRVKQIDFAA